MKTEIWPARFAASAFAAVACEPQGREPLPEAVGQSRGVVATAIVRHQDAVVEPRDFQKVAQRRQRLRQPSLFVVGRDDDGQLVIGGSELSFEIVAALPANRRRSTTGWQCGAT